MKKLLLALILICTCLGSIAKSQVSDDRLTVGLWRMNASDFYTTATRSWMDDSDELNPGRENNMPYGNPVNDPNSYPVLSEAGGGYDGIGEAMVYNGGQSSWAFNSYGNFDSIRIELWFFRAGNMITGSDETLISVGELPDYAGRPWELRLRGSSGNRVYFYVHTSNGVVQAQQLYEAGVWNKVVAIIDPYNGAVSIEITPDGFAAVSASTAFTGQLLQNGGRVYMGCRTPGVNAFNGKLDEVKLSILPPVTDDGKTVSLWHLDYADQFTAGSQIWLADDDAFREGRDNDLALPADANFAPTFTTGTQSYNTVGQALNFTSGDYAYSPNAWKGYSSVEIDMWFYRVGDLVGDQTLVTAGSATWPFELRLRRSSGNRLYFYAVNNLGQVKQLQFVIPVNVWNHVVASVDAEGIMSLTVTPKGGAPVVATPINIEGTLLPVTGDIWLGCTRVPGTRPFVGLMDEIKISILGDMCGIWGYSVADFNKDCVVDDQDLAEFALYWLNCSLPNNPDCGIVD